MVEYTSDKISALLGVGRWYGSVVRSSSEVIITVFDWGRRWYKTRFSLLRTAWNRVWSFNWQSSLSSPNVEKSLIKSSDRCNLSPAVVFHKRHPGIRTRQRTHKAGEWQVLRGWLPWEDWQSGHATWGPSMGNILAGMCGSIIIIIMWP